MKNLEPIFFQLGGSIGLSKPLWNQHVSTTLPGIARCIARVVTRLVDFFGGVEVVFVSHRKLSGFVPLALKTFSVVVLRHVLNCALQNAILHAMSKSIKAMSVQILPELAGAAAHLLQFYPALLQICHLESLQRQR